CGARNFDLSAAHNNSADISSQPISLDRSKLPSDFTTAPFVQNNPYRQICGSLMTSLDTSVQASTAQLHSRLAKRMVLALISIPIWLIIILLSPLDAYATAKSMTRQI